MSVDVNVEGIWNAIEVISDDCCSVSNRLMMVEMSERSSSVDMLSELEFFDTVQFLKDSLQ